MHNRDILIVGQQAWDTAIGSNCKDIAIEFSKTNRVLYINAPLDRRTKLQHKDDDAVKTRLAVINGEKDGLEEVLPNLFVYYPDTILESISFIKWTSVFKIFNFWNNKKFATSISKALKRLNFDNFILFNDSDMFRSYHLKELLKPSISIYYSRDNMLATPYWGHHGQVLEPELMAKSDLCVANSVYLSNSCKKYNQNSFYVGQGCDFTKFDIAEERQLPDDLAKISKPILGYVGALLSMRLDENIIIHLAKQKPEYSIVLVGPEDDQFKNSVLHEMTNVYFLGPKPVDQLASYISGFDVCLNPQAINPLTIGNYPRKIDEYLAMGKPAVATHTEAMESFKDYVYLAHSKEDYVYLIDKALNESNHELIEGRVAFAKSHTWENNVNEIYKAINLVSSK